MGVSLCGAVGEIPPWKVQSSNPRRDPVRGQTSSAKAQGGLTARLTSRAGTQVGLSDLAVASGSAVT